MDGGIMNFLPLKSQQIARYELQETPPDLLIQTSVDDYGILDFYKAEELVQQGVEAARKALEGTLIE